MQQLHCNSPRAGLLLRASRLRAASEQRASAFAVAQGRPALIGRAACGIVRRLHRRVQGRFGCEERTGERVSILAMLLGVTCRVMILTKCFVVVIYMTACWRQRECVKFRQWQRRIAAGSTREEGSSHDGE